MKRTVFFSFALLTAMTVSALPKNFEKTHEKALQGNAKASIQMAEWYRNGADGISVSIDSAAFYYGIAAASKKEAQLQAGILYRQLYKRDKNPLDAAKSLKFMVPYMQQYAKTGVTTLYELMVAETYFDLGEFGKAESYYERYPQDGLSIIRLESRKSLSDQQVNVYKNGLIAGSADMDDYKVAADFANRQITIIYIETMNEDLAVRHYCNYTRESEADAYIWIGNYYLKEKNDQNSAVWDFKKAKQLGAKNVNYTIAKIYYDQKEYNNAIPFALDAVKEQDGLNENLIVANSYFQTAQNDKAFPYWKRLTDFNYAPAYIRLGECYQNGRGCEVNDSLAIINYEQGLKTQKWAWAQCELGKLYESQMRKCMLSALMVGNDTEECDPSFYKNKAISWYEKAVAQNYVEAKSLLAKLYVMSDDTKNKALPLLDELLADKKYREDAWRTKAGMIGDSVYMSLVETQNYEELKKQKSFLSTNPTRIIEINKILSENGDFDACVALADAYYEGKIQYKDFFDTPKVYYMDKDTAAAFNYYVKAHEIDPSNKHVSKKIVDCYVYGIGVKQDLDVAQKLYDVEYGLGKKSDHFEDQYFYEWKTWRIWKGEYDILLSAFAGDYVGNLYMPYDKSISYLKKAASSGTSKQKAEALYYLGRCYGEGLYNVTTDYSKAISYLKQSAGLNYASACYYLGEVYRRGLWNNKVNCAVAAEYYHKCYQLNGDQDAYYYYLHCWNRSH